MIGWKAKWGYIPYANGGYDVKDFVVTDESYFVFPQTFNLDDDVLNNPFSIASKDYKHNGSSFLYIQSALQSCFGSEYANIFGCPGYYYNSSAHIVIIDEAPTFPNMCPNLWSYIKNPDTNANHSPTCYIPALHRYVRYNFSTVSNGAAILSEDGALLGTFPKIFTTEYQNLFCVLSYLGSTNIDDFRNPSNYKVMQCSNIGFGYYVTGFDDSYTKLVNGLNYLFSVDNFSPPEIVDGTPENPYPVEPSGPGTLPPGTFDFDSDPIPDSPLPSLSAANTGFTRIYNPTLSQVQSLARYLWTDTTVIETIWNHLKQYFEDPMQAMIGFNLLPCPIPDAGSEEFALMYIGTGVYMNVAANQFVDVDCGTLDLERVYGSALDQAPYTKVHCYLPYIGTVQLDTDEVMGTTLQVKYRIDIVSGSCVAKILIDGNVLYQFSGHCAITIPFASADFSNYVTAAISVAKLGAGVAAGAGLAALASASQDAVQETNRVVTRTSETAFTERNPITGRQITTRTERTTSSVNYPPPADRSETKASFAGLSPANVSNTVGQIMASKMLVQHSGSFSGNSGYLGVRRPYLIIERPNMCLPENYQSLNGYPSMITMTLGECVGYTRVQQVQLTGMWATNPEQAEILQLLKSGVIF